MLENRFPSVGADLSTICKYLQEFKAAFPELRRLYVTSLVIISSAACESSFSTLSLDLPPFRRTVRHDRKKNLVILAHEKAITAGLDMDPFVSFCAQKQKTDAVIGYSLSHVLCIIKILSHRASKTKQRKYNMKLD